MKIDILEEKKYQNTFNYDPDAVIIIDTRSSEIEYFNLAAKNLFGDILQINIKCFQAIHQTQSPPPNCPINQITNKGYLNAKNNIQYGNRTFSVTVYFINSGNKIVHRFIDITESVNLKKILQESEEKYRLVVENAAEAIILINNKGEFNYVNQIMITLTGYSERELDHLSMFTLIHPDYLPLIKENFIKRMAGQELETAYDIKIVRKDQQEKWVRIKSKLIDPEMILVFAEDVTPQKLAEDLLTKEMTQIKALNEERKLKLKTESALMTLSNKVINVSSLENIATFVGETLYQILGQDILRVVGYITPNNNGELVFKCPVLDSGMEKNTCNLMNNNELQFLTSTSIFAQVLKGEIQENPLIIDYQAYSNKKIPIGHIPLSQVICISLKVRNEILGCIMVNRKYAYRVEEIVFLQRAADLCALAIKQKKAYEVIKVKQKELDVITKTCPNGIHFCDITGRIQFANPAHARMLGYEPGKTIGMFLWDFMPNDEIANKFKVMTKTDLKKYFLEVLVKEQPQHVIKSFSTKNQTLHREIIDVRIDWDYVYDENEILSYFTVVLTDISLQKKIEDELINVNNELAKAIGAKDKFLSMIVHDIKNPIGSAFYLGDLCLNLWDTIDDTKKKNYLKRLKDQSDSCLKLINDLVNWVQSQKGELQCRFVNYFLKELIELTTLLLEEQMIQKNLNCRVSVPDGIRVYVDENIFQTILRNLLSNAIKFTPKNGDITIEAKSEENSKVRITVADTGIGISKEDLKKIFRIDIKYSKTGTDGERGTGFGLVLCKEFVEKLGGEIWVESEIGKGSKFILTVQGEKMKK